jgi:hypothetical protein
MYIKVFESRQSSNGYTIRYRIAANNAELDRFELQNQDHKTIIVTEAELFKSLNDLFNSKASKNENAKERCEES